MRQKAFTPWVVGGVIVLLLVAGALVLLTRAREDDGTLERVQATGELRVGLDASFPPFESLDADGNIIGYDADLARAIAGAVGAEPVFVNIGFDGLYDALQADRVDVVISGLPYDPRRTQDVIYSQPYFNAGQVLVVRADDETFSDPDPGAPDPGAGAPDRSAGTSDRGPGTPDRRAGIPDRSAGIPMPALSGRIVAVEWGSLADMETRRLKETVDGLQTLPQPTAQDALGALVAGQADAAVADAVSVFQFIGGEGGEQVCIVETLTDEPYVIASRARSRRLGQVIDEVLAELRESGMLDELMQEWF
jgi:polar amino acid transport system substrate-binding protein